MADDALIFEHGPELFAPAEAVFDRSRTYRYRLTRTWDQERPAATWIMLNPSTADALSDDPTSRRCAEFSRAIDAGGMIIVNLFAYRSSKPYILYYAKDAVGELNDAFILEACRPPAVLIAAWGTHGALRGRAASVTRMLTESGVSLQCFGTTRDGHPRHPLYVRGSTALEPYTAPDPGEDNRQ